MDFRVQGVDLACRGLGLDVSSLKSGFLGSRFRSEFGKVQGFRFGRVRGVFSVVLHSFRDDSGFIALADFSKLPHHKWPYKFLK